MQLVFIVFLLVDSSIKSTIPTAVGFSVQSPKYGLPGSTEVTPIYPNQTIYNEFTDDRKYYKYTLPSEANVTITMTPHPATADYDLYVTWDGTYPNLTAYDCRPYEEAGIEEVCTRSNLLAGTYYFMVRWYTGSGLYDVSLQTEPAFPPPEMSLSVNTFKNDIPIVSNITLFDENQTIIETVKKVSSYDWLLPIGIYHVQASILYNEFVYTSERIKMYLTEYTELGIPFQFSNLTVSCVDVDNRPLQDCTLLFKRENEERTNRTDSLGSTVVEAYYGNWTIEAYWMGVPVGEINVEVYKQKVEVNIQCTVGDFVVIVVNQYGDLVKANVTLTNTTYELSFSGYLDGVIENLTFVQIPLIGYTLGIKDDFETGTYFVDTSENRQIRLEVSEIMRMVWVEKVAYIFIGAFIGLIIAWLIMRRRLRVKNLGESLKGRLNN